MTVDLILFAGQSNMAGRGVTSEAWPQGAPRVTEGAGWEYRAVSAPEKLWPVAEPFGAEENRVGGIDDRRGTVPAKTGSMVSAFINAYYEACGVPVVGVSASKGGSAIREWQPDGQYLTDALRRLQAAKVFLSAHGYTVRRTDCLWCQGETDGDLGTSAESYRAMFLTMWDAMQQAGMERLLMVRIGHCNLPGAENRYQAMMDLQEKLAVDCPQVYMVARGLAGMRSRGLMKDAFHYYQQAYNEIGVEAGKAAAEL